MSTPIFEEEQHSFPAFQPNHPSQSQSQSQDRRADDRPSSDEDGTLTMDDHHQDHNHLRVTTSYASGAEHLSHAGPGRSPTSPSAQREEAQRLDDDLLMLRAERIISTAENKSAADNSSLGRSRSMARSRSRTGGGEPVDDFDVDTTPIHEKTKIYSPPANPTTKLAKAFKRIHNSSFLVRYFFYITPLMLLLLIPTLFGLLLFKNANVAGVKLFWFGIW